MKNKLWIDKFIKEKKPYLCWLDNYKTVTNMNSGSLIPVWLELVLYQAVETYTKSQRPSYAHQELIRQQVAAQAAYPWLATLYLMKL
jgi:hypothetical protein